MGPEHYACPCREFQTSRLICLLMLSYICSWLHRQVSRSGWSQNDCYVTSSSMGKEIWLFIVSYQKFWAFCLVLFNCGSIHWLYSLQLVLTSQRTSTTIHKLRLSFCNKLFCSNLLFHSHFSSIMKVGQPNILPCFWSLTLFATWDFMFVINSTKFEAVTSSYTASSLLTLLYPFALN